MKNENLFSTVLNQEQFEQQNEGKWQQAPSTFETPEKLFNNNHDKFITKEKQRGLWLVHTARERDRDRPREMDQHNRKQWVLVPLPVLDQCEHFYTIY